MKTTAIFPILLLASVVCCSAEVERVFRSNGTFMDRVLPWNIYYKDVIPSSLQYCESEQDVLDAIAYARDSRVRATIRSSGHSFAALSIARDQTVIDVSRFNDVEVDADARMAHVGPGTTTLQLNDALFHHGLYSPGVHCADVAMGASLSGGFGYYHRMYGLQLDHVVSMRVALADGSVVDTAASNDTELDWALKGAGAGSYGVVTRFSVRAYPTPDRMVKFSAHWDVRADRNKDEDADKFVEVLTTFESWTRTLPYCLTPRMDIWLSADGLVRLKLSGVAVDSRICDAHSLAAPMLSIGNKSGESFVRTSWARLKSGCCEGLEPTSAYIGSSLLGTDLGEEGAREFWSVMLAAHQRGEGLTVIFMPFGGAVADVSEQESSFVLRHPHAWMLSIKSSDHSREGAFASISSIAEYRDRMRAHSSGHSYRNYASAVEQPDYMTAYFGDEERVRRLIAVKRRYDPTDMFAHAHSVPLA